MAAGILISLRSSSLARAHVSDSSGRPLMLSLSTWSICMAGCCALFWHLHPPTPTPNAPTWLSPGPWLPQLKLVPAITKTGMGTAEVADPEDKWAVSFRRCIWMCGLRLRDRTRLQSVWDVFSGHDWSSCPVKEQGCFTAAIIPALWGEQNRIPSRVWACFYSLHSPPTDRISFLRLVLDWCPLSSDVCVYIWPAALNTERCLDSLIKKSSLKHHYPSLVTEQRRQQRWRRCRPRPIISSSLSPLCFSLSRVHRSLSCIWITNCCLSH